jgi:hypothetical protein
VGTVIETLTRRPTGLAELGADAVRALAPVSTVVAVISFGYVESALFLLVFAGVLLSRAAGLPPLLDILTSITLLAAAWFSVADLYNAIAWLDLVTHFFATGVLTALARVLLERWDAAGLAPSRADGGAASVVAAGLIGGAIALALASVWEFLEWWGYTYIDDSINVGYLDTLGDVAAGGLGGVVAGMLLATSSDGRRR